MSELMSKHQLSEFWQTQNSVRNSEISDKFLTIIPKIIIKNNNKPVSPADKLSYPDVSSCC